MAKQRHMLKQKRILKYTQAMPNKYVFVLKPKINRLWSLTAWVQFLVMSLIIYVTLSKLLKCSVPPFL